MAREFVPPPVDHGPRGKGRAAFDTPERFDFAEHRRYFNCMRVAEYPGEESYRALGTGLFTEAALMAVGFNKFKAR